MNLPVNFNEENVNYGVIGFEGAENSEIVEDPTDATNKVVRVVRSNTAATFAGTTVTAVTNGVQTGFASPIPFTATDTRMSVRVWSPDAGIQVRLKVEDFQDPTKSVETEATSTVAGDWETLVFNFANQAQGTEALNINNSFNKATIFFNFGVDGPTAGEKTYYFDDMAFVAGGDDGDNGGETGNLPTIPVNFESDDLEYEFINFEGGEMTRIANPQSNEDNNSGFVGQMVKGPGAVFAGAVMPLASPMDFSQGKTVRVKVFMPRAGAKLLFKVENQTNPDINFEREVTGTVANGWETLDIDYSQINTSQSYQKIVLIFDLGTQGDGSANFTYLIDDIEIVASDTGGEEVDENQMDLPVTFDDEEVNYGVLGFEGAENSEIVEDPTDATNKVVRVVRSNTAATFAGTTVTAVTNGVQTGFASPIPFTATDTRMSVRVWSPDAGIQVRLKVEDFRDPTKSVETEATSTVAGDWETLVFNFANQAQGTEALNINNSFNKATIFFNFGVDGPTAGEKTYYFDDMIFGEPEIDECLGLEKPSISISGQGTEVITLTSSAEEGNQWFLDGSPIDGATNQTLQVTKFGIFTVQVTIGDCISEFADNVSLVVNSVGIKPNREVRVYPNPVENRLSISGLSSDVSSLQLIDATGRLYPAVFEYESGVYQADVSSISKGLYILWIQEGNRSFPIKVIKK